MANALAFIPAELQVRVKAFGGALTKEQKDVLADILADMMAQGYAQGLHEAQESIKQSIIQRDKNLAALLF